MLLNHRQYASPLLESFSAHLLLFNAPPHAARAACLIAQPKEPWPLPCPLLPSVPACHHPSAFHFPACSCHPDQAVRSESSLAYRLPPSPHILLFPLYLHGIPLFLCPSGTNHSLANTHTSTAPQQLQDPRHDTPAPMDPPPNSCCQLMSTHPLRFSLSRLRASGPRLSFRSPFVLVANSPRGTAH